MNYRIFDRARRAASPVEVNLVEAYAQGRVSRRDFVRKGTIIGLSIPFMSAVIAACGSDDDDGGSSPDGSSGGGSVKEGGTMKIASQSPSGPLDPLAMADLGSYGIVAQTFEHLLILGSAGDLVPGLATEWTPNADASVWTFKLREGVKWQGGGTLTSADVVATMDRLATGGNAALGGIVEAGSTKAVDDLTVEFNLTGPNGQLPVLVSVYNAQAVITPVAWEAGSTADGKKDGTGAWKRVSYDQATGAKFERNPDWWGAKPHLDSVEWIFSDDIATQVSGLQSGSVDAIVQFSVLGGDAIFADTNLNVLEARTATHRQIWMRNDEGQFTDKRARQAIAYCLDRENYLERLFKGRGDVANDHPIAPAYAFFDAAAVEQRVKDIDKAKSLLAEVGLESLKVTLHAPELQEIPQLAELVKADLEEAGIECTLAVESTDTFYNQWCLTYDPICDGGQEFGIVDYGHRPTPDTYLNAAYATGEWNSAHFVNEEFNAAFKEYQSALDVDAQKVACGKMEVIANDEVPYAIPYFYNYLSAHSKKFTGVRVTALGQMFLDAAGEVS